jgi:hypothetical protein
VSRAFPSWNRSILTEIYLCHACSDHEIEDGNGAEQVVTDVAGVSALEAAGAPGGAAASQEVMGLVLLVDGGVASWAAQFASLLKVTVSAEEGPGTLVVMASAQAPPASQDGCTAEETLVAAIAAACTSCSATRPEWYMQVDGSCELTVQCTRSIFVSVVLRRASTETAAREATREALDAMMAAWNTVRPRQMRNK